MEITDSPIVSLEVINPIPGYHEFPIADCIKKAAQFLQTNLSRRLSHSTYVSIFSGILYLSFLEMVEAPHIRWSCG